MIVTPARFVSLATPFPCEERRTFVFRGPEMLVRRDDLALPDAPCCAKLGLDGGRTLPVGLWDGAYCEAAWVSRDAEPLEGYAYTGLRALFGRVDDAFLAVAGRAFQIADWARTNRFCGACGAAMRRLDGERAMKCPACGHVAYPRISPAMMVLVRRGPAILLARNVAAPPGRYSALAGFLDPGESVEEAIHREVKEEVGLDVKDLRYFASQSWPFPHSLMLAFTAEHAGGDIRLDASEIADARWFGPGDPLPELSPRQSISRALIDANLPGARA